MACCQHAAFPSLRPLTPPRPFPRLPLCGCTRLCAGRQECAGHWKHIREYFDVFLEYALLGMRQRAQLVQRGVPAAFVDFMCYDYQWTVYQNPDYSCVVA